MEGKVAIFHRLLLKAGATAAVWLMLSGPMLQAADHLRGTPRLEGTFLQLLNRHGQWQAEDWSQLFGYFRRLQLSRLIVQWTVFGQTAFYPSQNFEAVARPPLETILQLADASGMQVWIGLAHDPNFWSEIQRDPKVVSAYLQRLRLRSASVAGELAPLVKKYPCFQGWYITEEVDDVNWREPEAREALFEYVGLLGTRLREITPTAKLTLSAFSQAQSSPQGFEKFWRTFFQRTPVDTVLLQDGVGANKLDLADLPVYLGAMRKAAEAESRQSQVVVEIFRQVDGPPLNDQPFRAVPAPWERIRRQMELAAAHSSQGMVAFSIPEYMTPLGGAEAEQLFSSYLKELGGAVP